MRSELTRRASKCATRRLSDIQLQDAGVLMSLYTDYLAEIEMRKEQGLHPKPIEEAALVAELIAQIKDAGNEHRADSLKFFIYNTLPGTTSAAGEKAKFLKEIILGRSVVRKSHRPLHSSCCPT
jgi:aconitate hydratase 2/2-methylisocitrate dehydratase